MAVRFTGDTGEDNLQVADVAALDYDIGDAFSCGMWIYRATTGGGTEISAVIGKPNTGTPQAWAFNYQTLGGNTIDFHLLDGANEIRAFGPDNAFLPQMWTHIGFTYDGSADVSGIKLYVNGVSLTTGGGSSANINSWTSGSIVNSFPLLIGGFFDAEWFAGGIANVVLVKTELTGTQMALLADLKNLNADPATLLSVTPDLWLPFTANSDFTTYDLNDYSGNNFDASVLGGTPVAMADPKVEYDSFSTLNFTTSNSVSHTPVRDPSAIVVLIAQDASSSDLISGVTYGGVAMTRVPTDGFAQDTAGEPGAAYAYLLGSGVPTGAQTAAITVASGTDAKFAWVVAFTAVGDVTIAASGKVEGDTANPSESLATPEGWAGTAVGVIFSGQNSPGSLSAGLLGMPSKDFGSQSGHAQLGSLSGTPVSVGWTATSEDVAMIALALGVTHSLADSTVRRRRTRTLARL